MRLDQAHGNRLRLALTGVFFFGVGAAPATAGVAYLVTNTNDSGPGSLREAILEATAVPNDIRFSIFPAGGVHTIRLLSPLPPLPGGTDLHGSGTLLEPSIREVIDGSLLTGPAPVGLRLNSESEVWRVGVTNFRDSAGGGVGIRMEGFGNRLERVFVGTDATGTVAQGNDTGVVVVGNGNTIGVGVSEANRTPTIVSGNGVGIAIASPGAASGTIVQQTRIGLGASGAPLPNTSHGIRLAGSAGAVIGGIGWRRVFIAFNGGAGVVLEGAADAGNVLRGNAIHSNGGLAVDLGGDGVTANDAGDADAGPNLLQNHPVIDAVPWSGTAGEVQGHLDSAPGQSYAIDFYAVPLADASGFGEAEWLIGTSTVTTDASGHAAFAVPVYGISSLAPFVSATATDAQGNTSELGPAVAVTGGPPPQPIYVVNTSDNVDMGSCSPAHCSLREAANAVNLNPNGALPDEVQFDVPGPGPHVLGSSTAVFHVPVVVDGYTQPGASPNTIAFGAGGLDTVLRIQVPAIHLFGGDSLVRGVAGIVRIESDRNVVEGCFLGTTATGQVLLPANSSGVLIEGSDNLIGGRSPAQRNLASAQLHGVSILHGSHGNVVEGNLIGTTVDGHGSLPNSLGGVSLGGGNPTLPVSGNRIGGPAPGAGNVISGNTTTGAAVNRGIQIGVASVGDVTGNVVQGNWIGLDAEGDDPLPNTAGIVLSRPGAHDNLIGGSGPGEANVVSGNQQDGIVFQLGALQNEARGNLVGTLPDGVTPAGNGLDGIFLVNAVDNLVVGNVVRANGLVGIGAIGSAARNRFSENSVGGNTGLGIDLGEDGVTPNDRGDADTGPNDLQNFPVLSYAAGVLSGTYSGAANATVRVEVFASAAPDVSQHGEGERFLGAQDVSTDASGHAAFTVSLVPGIPPGAFLSATATGASGSTSELGPVVPTPRLYGGELQHGSASVHDLAAGGTGLFNLAQDPTSSYEVVVDAVSADLLPLRLERLATDGTTVLQSATPTGTGASVGLRWRNVGSLPLAGEAIRVRSGGCASDCGPDDVYRIRSYDSTYRIARFNNTGSQVTVVLLQNPADASVEGALHFWSASGALLHTQAFALSPHGLYAFDMSSVAALVGQGGSVTVSSNAGYAQLAGKAVALEPSTGFAFDSPLSPRPR